MSDLYAALNAKALEPKELTLTFKGMSSVNWNGSDSDFEFVFSEDKVCCVHSVLAEFLSPKVARLRRCDISFEVYTFKDSELFNVFESLVSSLRYGAALRVEKSNFAALLRLAQELENAELLSWLLGMIKTEFLDLELAILLLHVAIDLGSAFSDGFGNLRDFVASRFYELEKEILDDLDLETAQILLSSPSLKIEDEDSLYDFVRSRSEDDLRFASLFEFIYFEYLSLNSIEDFSCFVSESLRENISSGIWSQICRRLILETKLKNNPRGPPGVEFVYDSSKPLEGVIAHLTRECGGNVHDQGIVNVTASSVYHKDRRYHQKNAADLGTDSCYRSHNKKDTWICYDFGDRRVIPRSYSVKSNELGPGGPHLKSWVIEVSNDGSSWTEIDRRENNNDLNGSYVTANFKISNVSSESFRFFRLRQTGKNHNGEDGFRIAAMEIFGTLLVMEKVEKTRPSEQEFVYHADREGQFPPPLFPPKLDGVIAHLTRECGGNVHDKGIVDVTASSVLTIFFQPKNAADLGTDWDYYSEDAENTWICYDFKERRVIPTSYSVRSFADVIATGGPGWNHLKSWVIEVSNDGSSWTEIDRRENNNDLNDNGVTANFKISNVPSESFRFFRLRQTGKNHRGDWYVSITSLEVFGILLEK